MTRRGSYQFELYACNENKEFPFSPKISMIIIAFCFEKLISSVERQFAARKERHRNAIFEVTRPIAMNTITSKVGFF